MIKIQSHKQIMFNIEFRLSTWNAAEIDIDCINECLWHNLTQKAYCLLRGDLENLHSNLPKQEEDDNDGK